MSLQKSNWKVPVILTAVVACLAMAWVIYAATTDFRANGPIVVPAVPGVGVTADLLIFDGSAGSWRYDTTADHYFKVTNPDSEHSFVVGSADSAVHSLIVYDSNGVKVLCVNNTMPGSSFAAIPPTTDTFSVVPASGYCPIRTPGKLSPTDPSVSPISPIAPKKSGK